MIEWHEVDSPGWKKLLAEVRHDFYHLPDYLALEGRRLAGHPRLFVYREASLLFALPLIEREIPNSSARDALSPYGYPGPIASPNADQGFLQSATAAFVEALTSERLVSAFVRFHPILSPNLSAMAPAGTITQHGPTVSIDLERTTEQMWADTRSGHRSEIQRGRRAGLVSEIDADWKALDEFSAIYDETMTAVGAGSEYFFDRSYYESLRDLTGANTVLATVSLGTEVLAGAVFLEVGGLVEYHLSGSRRAHAALAPTKYLLDEVRLWAKLRGYHTLHLGGGVGGRQDGLYDFKAGFSRRRHSFSTWRIVLDPEVYKDLCGASGVETAGDFFPAYRQSP